MRPRETTVCDGRGWVLNMGGPPRTKVKLDQAPVSKRVLVFDLAHALAARDLVPSTSPWQLLDSEAALRLAREQWRGDANLLRDAIDAGPSEPVPEFVLAGRGALVGWPVAWDEARRAAHHELCTDLGLTVEVLARRVGDLLLLARTPRFEWEQLFATPFALDDERFAPAASAAIAPVPEPTPTVRICFHGEFR